jgi:hypothetical protein
MESVRERGSNIWPDCSSSTLQSVSASDKIFPPNITSSPHPNQPMYNNFNRPLWPSPELLTLPKEQTQLFKMASGSQTPEPPSALPTPNDTSNGSNSSDDNNNVPNEPAALPTPDNTSNASNSSGNINAQPEPKIYYGEKRIYVYPKDHPYDHPYDEQLPEHWDPKKLAQWDATFKQKKIQEGEAEWDKMVRDGRWNRKKKGVFVYWAWLKDGRHHRWVLRKEDPPD